MIELATAWQDHAWAVNSKSDDRLRQRIDQALASAAMQTVRSLLGPLGLRIEPTPIVHKYLSDQHLRLMFPVTGSTIQLGTVVSIVCLYDCSTEETLYAHAMHAGPGVNPLLRHPDGPMAAPKSQPGQDGDRATTRMISHKEALWRRFQREVDVLGTEEASLRWRRGYYWALKRLYFCTRCTSCRWGTPFFDGPDPAAPPKISICADSWVVPLLEPMHDDAIREVVASSAWKIEKAYARRGGWDVSEYPRIIRHVGNGFVQMIFPTNAALIQGGTVVAVSVVHSTLRRETIFAHCLCAGPEPEVQFLLGDHVLGLPSPCDAASEARATYIAWRAEAWSQFWLDELEHGIDVASKQWLQGFWQALEELFGGGNGISRPSYTQLVDHDVSNDENRCNEGEQASSAHSLFETRATQELPVLRPPKRNATTAIPFETLENTGGKCFTGHVARLGPPELHATGISTLMVNLGRRCNQACSHCHIDAGPHRREEMSRETVDLIVDAMRRHHIDTLDITGGAPEMNPHFRYLASTASELCKRVIDRCNLTILLEPGYEDLAEFLSQHELEITASMPDYKMNNVDRQRGRGVFEKSIEALRLLNTLGYGQTGSALILNLVYNPADSDLAPSQQQLENRFRQELHDKFGLVFNRLFAMNNMPVNRFRSQLVRQGRLEAYMDKLVGAYHSKTVDGLMCRHSLSVGWDGRLFDCDFNQAADLSLSDGLPSHIRDFDALALRTRTINTAAHCFGCAAGFGSSCNGALTSTSSFEDGRRNGRSHPPKLIDAQDARIPI